MYSPEGTRRFKERDKNYSSIADELTLLKGHGFRVEIETVRLTLIQK